MSQKSCDLWPGGKNRSRGADRNLGLSRVVEKRRRVGTNDSWRTHPSWAERQCCLESPDRGRHSQLCGCTHLHLETLSNAPAPSPLQTQDSLSWTESANSTVNKLVPSQTHSLFEPLPALFSPTSVGNAAVWGRWCKVRLLAAEGLLLRSFWRLQRSESGGILSVFALLLPSKHRHLLGRCSYLGISENICIRDENETSKLIEFSIRVLQPWSQMLEGYICPGLPWDFPIGF